MFTVDVKQQHNNNNNNCLSQCNIIGNDISVVQFTTGKEDLNIKYRGQGYFYLCDVRFLCFVSDIKQNKWALMHTGKHSKFQSSKY